MWTKQTNVNCVYVQKSTANVKISTKPKYRAMFKSRIMQLQRAHQCFCLSTEWHSIQAVHLRSLLEKLYVIFYVILSAWPAKRHSSNIFVSISTPGSDCRGNSLSRRSLHLSAELFQYSKNETRQHIVLRTDARTDIYLGFLRSICCQKL